MPAKGVGPAKLRVKSSPRTTHPGVPPPPGVRAAPVSEEAMRLEIESLRAEVKQLRQTVEMLLSMVMEHDEPRAPQPADEEGNRSFYN